ncbi:MAG TPA: hypothetical protein DDW76_26345 [Cyanobacteria bacterium UBA11369]|nr:hypothetical protein [Cyanobacteria bacterium UBA11371]HBE18386.1 hypothetical protein [Cyanobacteria bacterium UBA11367]HBE36736.1 hypothetical protein [Cyanobacteria bacterium UBA11368]HBE52194.1 hypothetical protein [Cyanobacteria bacterium UBA11369]
MKIKHVIQVNLTERDSEILPGAKEFIKKYAANSLGERGLHMFLDKNDLAEALAMLSQYGLKYERFYDLEVESDELETYPALFFNFPIEFELFVGEDGEEWADATVINDYQMVEDCKSHTIVVSPLVKQIVERTTKGVQWQSVETTNGEEWFIMQVTEILPNPIIVVSPIEVKPYEKFPEVYSVICDDRFVVTIDNIAKLAEVGMALSLNMKISSEVLRWDSCILASGKVIHALESAGIKQIRQDIHPLLTPEHPLSH